MAGNRMGFFPDTDEPRGRQAERSTSEVRSLTPENQTTHSEEPKTPERTPAQSRSTALTSPPPVRRLRPIVQDEEPQFSEIPFLLDSEGQNGGLPIFLNEDRSIQEYELKLSLVVYEDNFRHGHAPSA